MPEKKTSQIPATAKVVPMLAIWENARKMAARSNWPVVETHLVLEGGNGGLSTFTSAYNPTEIT